MPEYKDRQFVDALARGMAILECLSRVQRPLGNSDIARLAGLAPSTVSRLTYTLSELGYIRRSDHQRTYELTPKNLTLGYPILAGMTLRTRVRPYLKSVGETTKQTVALAVRDGLYISFVEVVQGTDPLAISLATGGRLRMNVSAAGIAILAAMSQRKRWSTLNRLRNDMQQRNENCALFEDAYQGCFQTGFALVRNSWQGGIGGIAVPLLWQGTLAALTMPIPTASVSRQSMRNELAPVLLRAADEIGRAPLVADSS